MLLREFIPKAGGVVVALVAVLVLLGVASTSAVEGHMEDWGAVVFLLPAVGFLAHASTKLPGRFHELREWERFQKEGPSSVEGGGSAVDGEVKAMPTRRSGGSRMVPTLRWFFLAFSLISVFAQAVNWQDSAWSGRVLQLAVTVVLVVFAVIGFRAKRVPRGE
jgi:hypothetical protein